MDRLTDALELLDRIFTREGQHAELLEIVVRQEVDYGRCHYPDRVRAMERAVANEERLES